jgi:predicted Zn-dependent protease
LYWVLAHELGHQVYNHEIDGDLPERERLAQSRKNETQADAFALQMMRRNGFEPLMAMPAYLILVGLNGYSSREEELATHPSGLRRMDIVLDSLKTLPDRDPEVKRQLEQKHLKEAWDKALRQMDDVIKNGLN